MRLTTRFSRVAVAATCLLLVAASCSNPEADDTSYANVGAVTSKGTAPGPDVNGDGKVVIGVLSPGNLNDHGYYESFVAKAEAFTQRKGWTLKRVGLVDVKKPGEALRQARLLCQQKVDLVALGAAELKDAIPAASEPVCAKTSWYVPSNQDIKINSRITISADFIDETLLAAGYATGLLMQSRNYTKVGYITGPKLDFSTRAAQGYIAGIRRLVPDAKLYTSYTGSFDDGKLAKAAAQKQINEGVQAMYPYLGGATDDAARLGNSKDLILSTPGTNRCDSTNPRFAISVIFDPGEYFAAALEDFSNGKLAMGVTRNWHLGQDTVPTVRLCNGTDAQNAQMAQFIADVGSGKIAATPYVNQHGQLDEDLDLS
ncbi:BMP family ABC transporter substrate-binding protein [Cryptosporangium phraense]|uniref:BMP family ABC transporter substrate-binding protein n=1 Tax=Cryptosporangium phraense TaxID=2593070 RepID=A0A545AYR0_9ACTN|nr:BMP family ABC transporter substrate-binding protein [Cryptosporangium phraense]TQS45715.1 BMP family ABC transporter substrate-binding protein [Cryptosporangium phraense]